jgi:hypothetical protein
MKVYLYGNILNKSYNLTLFLRAKGIDVEMFLDDSSALQQDYPWWEDSILNEVNLPQWIHYYKVEPNFLLPPPMLREIIRCSSRCDVALVCGRGPIVATRANVPFLFYSYGGDFNITKIGENIYSQLTQILFFKKPKGLKTSLLNTHTQYQAIKRADRIGIVMGYQINPYVKYLGFLSKMQTMRMAWDIDKCCGAEDRFLNSSFFKPIAI